MDEENKDLEKTDNRQLSAIDAQVQAFEQMNKIAKRVVDQVSDDRDKSDELYDFMRDQVEIDNDKNPATRDAMAKAMELKMKGTDQMIELLKIKAKLINPNKGTSININLGEYDNSKGGDTTRMLDVVSQLKKDMDNDNE